MSWSWLFVAYLLAQWVIRIVMVPVILHRRFLPGSSLAWLGLIFLWPEVGLGIYLLLGVSFLGKKKARSHPQITRPGDTPTARALAVRACATPPPPEAPPEVSPEVSPAPREVIPARPGSGISPAMPGPSAAQPTPEPTPPTTPGSADPSPICGLRDDPAHDPATVNMVRQAEAISGNLILGGNHAEPVVTTDDLLARLTADLDTAQHHAHLLYYICRDDRIGQGMAAALIRAAGRGVACRLLLDAAGSRRFLKSPTCRALRDAGVEVHEALPVSLWRKQMARMDLRNHRKIAVIDGRIAYTGSHNMVEPSYGHARAGKWVDLSGRFTGPVVAQVQAVFADDWAFETGQVLDDETFFPVLEPTGDAAGHVIPTGPAAVGETFRRVVVAALHSARHRIILTTPYLVPDEPTMLALAMAVARGVEVTVIVPRRSDQIFVGAAARSYFEPLLEAGVQIHRYTAGLLHAKTITVDDAFALMGSANLDIRSFHLNFELSNLFYGPHITRQMRFAQQSYLADAEELTLDHWSQRPAWKQFLDRAAALLSPVL